ncbi:myosin E [Nitzschia inconspicua]|uniref:Myosin E n=1 Tax=Nitzschia inconspicua TaxID=303405 RepID=A0A9K3M1Y8_9STRA|nr:myosin E [Nitzschia inconspicua]
MSGGGGTSNNVYIRSEEYAWIPARLVEQDKTQAKVAIPQYSAEEFIMSDGGKAAVGFKSAMVKLKDYQNASLPLQNVGADGTLKEVDDMVDLPYLHEAAILYNLKKRHIEAKPYSRVADIVIAVNPYQWLTDLYADKVRMYYAQKIVWDRADKDPRLGLPPHIYEVSSLCYKGLAYEKQNQSILVSGESGAGKTETVKICMNHIATVQQNPDEQTNEMSPVVKRILDSNPLLEAFGNAKTRRNDNSSRFGKYIMLQFHHENTGSRPRAALAGSTCEVYLLEKSRVVYHDDTERTYHIFYQLIRAAESDKVEIWKGLKGTTCESYAYVGTPPNVLIEGKEDGDHFKDTKAALDLIGVTGEKYLTLFRAIAAVLQLGNLTFKPKASNEEETEITSKKELKDLAELIGANETTLNLAFTERTIKTRGEEYKVPLKADVAKESADAFAKEIYAKVFLWLVRTINDATCAENNYKAGASIEYGLIGLLDIFGFESFPVNGFEQLCINYCNEKLQQKFTQDIFRTVQEEYKNEGLDLAEIKYDDNSDVLELIEGKFGLIKQLNEECVRPKGNDQAFVSKALQSNKTVPCLIAKSIFTSIEFGIHHYAGPVIYRAQDFVTRNTDTLPADMQEAAKSCTNEIIAKHLDNSKCSNQGKDAVSEDSSRAPPRRAKSNITADTVMTQFKNQLTSLMKGLSETQSRYIRCVKPNTEKRKLVMQHITTLEQLRCAGVVAAVTISRSAYPSKLDHSDVISRYGMLNEGKPKGGYPNQNAEIEDLLTKMLVQFEYKKKDGSTSKAYAMGKTKVYFKGGCLEFLESERAKIWDKWAVKIQAPARGFVTRRRIMRMKYAEFEAAVIPIQCMFRVALAKVRVQEKKKNKKREKRMGKKSKKAAIRIQAIVRGFIQRPRYKKALLRKKEEEDLAKQLDKMKDKLAEAEDQRKRDLEDARFQFEQEMEEYKEKLEDQLRAEADKQNKSAQQQTLIDESGKIIEYLRKENMKLRQQCESMKRDYKSLKENNARLMEANASASNSFNQLNEHAKGLNATNARLIKNVDTYKQQLVKMKEDLKNRQAFYLAEAHARVAYQKTLARIVAQVQDKSRDAQLVEDVVIWALECEAEAKSERAALENAGQKAPPGAATAAAPQRSNRPGDSDSDSDSD